MRRRSNRLVGSLMCLGLSSVCLLISCTWNGERGVNTGAGGNGGSGPPHMGTGGMGMRSTLAGVGDAYTGPCRNLECRQNSCTQGPCTAQPCAAGGKTTVSGTVYDPAGKVPLYNVVVYVPNAPLEPIHRGRQLRHVRRRRCRASRSSPRSPTRTGSFVLENVPVGADIPLVIQVGKWRRADHDPDGRRVRRHAAHRHEPDAPAAQPERRAHPEDRAHHRRRRRARVPAAQDRHRRRRVHAREPGTGRVNLFAGDGGTNRYDARLNGGAAHRLAPEPGGTATANLLKYDIVLHSCEGGENPTNKSAAARSRRCSTTRQRAAASFASHWHNYWLEHGPAPLPDDRDLRSSGTTSPDPFTAHIDTSFPKGQAMSRLAGERRRLDDAGPARDPRRAAHVDAVNTTLSQRWIYSDAMPAATQRRCHVDPVLHVQHADRRGPPSSSAGASCSATSTSPPATADRRARAAVPDRLHGDRPVAAGEGARVHAVRSLVVHHPRLRGADPAGDHPVGFRTLLGGRWALGSGPDSSSLSSLKRGEGEERGGCRRFSLASMRPARIASSPWRKSDRAEMGAAGPAARREEGEYSPYLTDEQRSRRAGSARFGDGRLLPRAARA